MCFPPHYIGGRNPLLNMYAQKTPLDSILTIQNPWVKEVLFGFHQKQWTYVLQSLWRINPSQVLMTPQQKFQNTLFSIY